MPSDKNTNSNNATSISVENNSEDELSKTNNSDETNTTHFNTAGSGAYGYENDTHTYTDPTDNTVYIWDREKSAWFPKVNLQCVCYIRV